MKANTVATYVLTLVLFSMVFVLALSYFLGHPVLVSYVESGSMEPALEEDDGFVLVPSQIASPVEVGDVVTFQSELVNGGRLTTHRVVRETKTGYITKGDANPFTDQDTGEPPVTDAQIVGKVLSSGRDPVAIPHLGTFVRLSRGAVESAQGTIASSFGTNAFMGTQGLAYILFGIGTLVFVLSVFFESSDRYGRTKSRDRDRDAVFSTWTVTLAAALLLVFVLTATMTVQGGPTKYEIVSSQSNPDTPRVVPAGESVDRKYGVVNPGLIPITAFVEPGSHGVEVSEGDRVHNLGGGESVNATVTFTAPRELGYYPMYVVEHRYFTVLPPPMIRYLYSLHPWTPLVAINGLIAGTFVVVSAVLIGTEPVRTRARSASKSWLSSGKKRKKD